MKCLMKLLAPAMLTAGAILLLIGAFFLFIKAGPPYQDPTPEMTFRYMAYMLAGKLSLEAGAVLAILGGVTMLVRSRMK